MSKPTSSRVLLLHTLAAMAKRVFVVFLALLTLTSVYSITRANVPVAKAAAPTTLNFQARLLNTSGSLVNDGTYNVEFKIYNASSSSGSSQGACTGDANCLWTETRTGANKIQVKNGYLSAYLGDISALPTNIWNQQLYLTMNIGDTGAASWDGEMTPRIRLTSVPYAFRATIAESAETLSKNTGSFTGTVEFATMTADRKYLFPDTSLATTASPGTICVYNGAASNCPAASGSAYYLQNDTVLQTQTNFHIQARDSGANGTIGGVITAAANGQTVDLLQFRASNDSTVLAAVTAAGNLQVASAIDTRAAGTLSVGTSTATSVSIGKSGAATTVNGQLAVTEAFSANGGATITGTTNINTTGTAVTTIGNSGAGVVLNGAVTVNEAATFNQNVVIAAEKTIRLVGGTTAQRPASPSEGMLYFDTTTKQLLTYANGKWQGDRSTATKIVAASNSSQAVKDSADYVADGTGDQAEINAALTAAAGGKVYLAEGTYVANATILVPNNTVLVGSGRGTLIELADLDATDNLIENSDTSTGTGVRIQDLRLDGRNDLNTAGTQYGIYLNGMGGGTGSSARQGGLISGVTANNFRSYGIFLTASSNNILTQNRVQGNTGGGIGLDASANYNTLTGNSVQGSVYGIVVATTGNTITGNSIQGHSNTGIYLIAAQNNTITGNSINGNSVIGVAITSASNTNNVTGNKFYDNGGATTNNSVYISNSDSNTITANNISDTSATTTNHAINIFDSTADGNYLSDNVLAGGGINDGGTGTIYGGQLNSAGNFLIQPTGTIELLKNTNVTGTLNISGNVDTNGSLTVGNANQFVISNTGVVTSGTWNGTAITDTYVADALTISSSGSVDWTALTGYPGACAAGSAVTQIADTLTCTAFATGSAGSYIQNQNASAQSTSDFWISGTGRADTSFLAPTFDVATAATLNIGTTNATALSISKSGVTTTINGALTVTEAGTFNGSLTAASNFTVTSAGNIAFQRNTTNYTGTGTQDDIDFGTGALFRITSASALTITSIVGGVDGRVITLANASANALTINNNAGGTAANRIITGTGANLSVPAGSTVQLAYDSADSRWRVIGGTATTGGGANQQLSNLTSTNINAPLNATANDLTLQTTTSGNIILNSAGTIELQDNTNVTGTLTASVAVQAPLLDTATATALNIGTTNATNITIGHNAGTFAIDGTNFDLSTAGVVTLAGGQAVDLTTQANQNLTVQANGIGTIVLNDTITVAGTTTFSGVTTDITTGTNEDLTIDANGTGLLQLSDSVVVAANQYLKLTGGNTASRPASPTEGMLYYDTETDQLLVYNGTKWLAEARDAYLVAANNSSAADKAAADYIADGTADEVEINAALLRADPASATGGARKSGKVYLFAGTYTTADTISVPNNTTLSGAGKGTLIQFGNLGGVSKNMITNTTTGGNGTGITIRDLKLDGNKSTNSTDTFIGIYLNGMGSVTTNLPGATITGVAVQNFENHGINLVTVANNIITDNTIQFNDDHGILTNDSNHDIITNNIITDNSLNGIYFNTTARDLVSGNIIRSNGNYGIRIETGNTNIITDNILRSNTGGGSSSSMYLVNTDTNLITNNSITDTAGTGYAIDISDAGSDSNYLSNNTFSGTGASSINDNSGGDTIYAGQVNGSTNYVIQPAGTIELMKNTNVTGTLTASTSVLAPVFDTATAVALGIGTTNATNITIGHNAGTLAIDQTNFDLSTAGVITLAGGQTADITTQANQNLTVVANGTGTIVLNDTVTVAGTQTFSGVTTDITTGTNEDLTIDANGSGLLQLSDSVVVAAQQTIRFVGGTTAQRPASPSEGMMYFDTTTSKLLIYSNGKWQGDRRDVTKTVAPSNAAQEIKDSADYVATGTSDQTTINAALTAAAGGRVYLFEGTFTTDDAISVPNNTVLAGSGAGTLVQFANIAGQSKNMITNTDTTTGTGVTVRDLRLDGNDGVNTTGSFMGIFFNGLGGYGTERRGGLIQGVTAQNFLTQGIRLENSVQTIVTGTTANNNGGSGMFLQSSSHNTITGNTASGNGVNGIGLNASSNNTITANTTSNNTQSGLSLASSSNYNAIDGNTSYANGGIGISLTTSSSYNTVSTNTSNGNASNGISLNAAHNNSLVGNTSSNNTLNGIGLTSANQNTLTGDTTSGNGTNGFSLSGSSRNTITGSSISSNLSGGTLLTSTSDDNVVSSGVLYDNGGSGAVSSITVTSSSSNKIIGNRITDTAGTAYAINISNAGANTNYLADNTFSGTGATTINDAGTGTIFAGQVKDSSNGNYFIQPAGTVELMKNTNVTGTLTASVAVQAPVFDTASAVALAIGNTNATAITLGRSGITTTNAGALTVTQLLTANAGITASGGALSLTGNAASSLTTSSGALTITSAAAATWSTAAGNLTVDSAAALQLGTGTATSLSVSRTGVTTTVNGALTVTQAGTFNGGLSVASDFTVTNAGNVAFQRNTTDFTTTGTSNDVNLGTGVLFRLNGATAQTITSITGGTDGRIITLVNAAANAATIQNDSGGTAANRIITGTGGDLSVPSGASIQLAYDSSASRWRVIGGSAVAGGGANQQLSNLSGTVAINSALNPNADNTIDLGTTANSWRTLYADTSVLTSRVDRAAAATLNIGTVTANAISISKSGTTTTVNGALTVTELGTYNGGLTVASNLTVSQAGNVAFQRNTTDYTGTGTQNDINFGTGALFRITSASALTITSITGGADGRLITLINASANDVTIQNDSGGTAANRIITGTGANITVPAGASLTLAYDSSSSRWRVIGSTAAANGYIQLQSSTPGTAQTGNFNINGTGIAATSLLTPTLDTPSGTTTLNIGTTNATAGINLNQNTQITGDLTLAQGANRTVSVGTRSSAGSGYNLTVVAGTGNGNNTGGTLLLQGGSAGGTNTAGGDVNVFGGAGTGTGVKGLVVVDTPTFKAATVQNFTGSANITQSTIDSFGTILISSNASGYTATLTDPTNTTAGRIVYVTNTGLFDMTLSVNGGGQGNTITLKPSTTATMVWNGSDWTAAGASSATDLQAAYNNTLTSAGGAELVLNASGGAADGLTIRNNTTTPISGGILEVQSSIGTNLFSVNNLGTELAANGGAETSSTFGTNWTLVGSASAPTRTTTAGQFVTGLAGVSVTTTSAAGDGVRNNLSGNPVVSTTYQVSFTAKLASGTFTDLTVQYSRDGGTDLESCTSYSSQTLSTSVWTKITCTITTDSTTATNPDLIIKQNGSGTARTFYIDNLSFMRNDATTQPSNVQIGGGINGGPVTLFTLDRSTAPPVANGDTTYLGSMYYDTTTGRIQCYEADGWGACGSAPDNIISLTPEYTGAVLGTPGDTGSGSVGAGIGVLTADFCSNQAGVLVTPATGNICASTEARNFYRWTSPQATQQVYSIFVNYKLPTTFKSFNDSNTIKLTALTDSLTNGIATLQVFRKTGSGVTSCGAATTINTSINTWQTTSFGGDETACGFQGGDNIVFKIDVKSLSNGNIYVENLDFTYSNR